MERNREIRSVISPTHPWRGNYANLKEVRKMGEGFYTRAAYCRNCDQVSTISIPKGTTVKEYFKESVKCPKCGCMGLSAPEEG